MTFVQKKKSDLHVCVKTVNVSFAHANGVLFPLVGKFFFDNIGCILSVLGDENKPIRAIDKYDFTLRN